MCMLDLVMKQEQKALTTCSGRKWNRHAHFQTCFDQEEKLLHRLGCCYMNLELQVVKCHFAPLIRTKLVFQTLHCVKYLSKYYVKSHIHCLGLNHSLGVG
ncbi:hypothetical protein CHARACLAT_023623 [Characodon lateralis]|uniref:Uncharacterized protein n=1 Tax=Characodon lateralis TaxID=208331 RepID=A0ABU7D9Y9_9TELE|nr:hypothetical protein [Characodon lateralis]